MSPAPLRRSLVAGFGFAVLAANVAAAPTFSNEVVRIFQNNCQNCHRPGVQFTPMGLTTYSEVRPWAKSIRKAVEERQMPPWHADPNHGKFKNDISLSQEEIDTILAWVDAGAPEGDPADLPPPAEFAEGWQIGEPDMVIDMGRDYTVPADGIVDYQFFVVETDFEHDMWVQAMEARAGNLDVVHHIVIYVRNPREGIQLPDATPDPVGNGLLGALSPGNTPSIYEPGQGKLLKKGAKLIFNMHYNTAGYETTDRSYIGLKFHKAPVEKQVVTRAVANMTFIIPPGAANYPVESNYLFKKDSTLLAMMPHMHYRGIDFAYSLIYPDGREETILDVPRYDFDWQVYYYPVEPIKLPAGTRMKCVAHYNNTPEQGAGRPHYDPNSPVRFGQQSHEEMMIGWIDYTVDEEDLREITAKTILPAETAPADGAASAGN